MKKLHVLMCKVASDVWEPVFSSFSMDEINLRKAKYATGYSKNKLMVKHFNCVTDAVSVYKCSFNYLWKDDERFRFVPKDSHNPEKLVFAVNDISIQLDITVDTSKLNLHKEDYLRIRHIISKHQIVVYLTAESSEEAFRRINHLIKNSLEEFIVTDTRRSNVLKAV